MRAVQRVGWGAMVGVAMLVASATVTAQPQRPQTPPVPLPSPAPPTVKDPDPGARSAQAEALQTLQSTLQALPSLAPPPVRDERPVPRTNARPAQAGSLQITPTDERFTDQDPRIAYRVEGCTSGDVRATSVAFSSSTFDASTNMLTVRIVDGLDSGTYDATFTCSSPPASQAVRVTISRSAEPSPELSFRVTDGVFTSADPRIHIRVSNCRSNDVRATSPIFSSSSYDRDSRTVTARIERGTESGDYRVTVTCRGQPTVRGTLSITSPPGGVGGGGGGGDSGGGGESSSDLPRGGVDTGRGGLAAGGVPSKAGWLLLLLSVPALAWLVSSGRLKGRRKHLG